MGLSEIRIELNLGLSELLGGRAWHARYGY